MMGSLSIWHWLLILIVIAAVIIPFWRILPRAGIPGWIGIFAILPGVALILLWILAFKSWPGDLPKQ